MIKRFHDFVNIDIAEKINNKLDYFFASTLVFNKTANNYIDATLGYYEHCYPTKFDVNDDEIIVPDLYYCRKFLEKFHNIIITVEFNKDLKQYVANIYYDDTEYSNNMEFNTFEEALNDGIEFAVNNILNL